MFNMNTQLKIIIKSVKYFILTKNIFKNLNFLETTDTEQ